MTTDTTDTPKLEQHLDGLHRLHRGKVRDIFAVDDHRMLIVATDRVSAFDVVLPQRLEGKGSVLTSLSKFWFEQTGQIIRNHVIETDVAKMPEPIARHAELLQGRSMLVHKCTPVKAEFVVRGYLAGSGWKEYQETGSVCGHKLPAGLAECDKLPEPMLTPATKAPSGEHDENITIAQLGHIVGTTVATRAGTLALELYRYAADLAASKGILLADTKIEFGLHQDRLMLIDEVFTPDSSRYWSATDYEPGRGQDSYDKQVIRDALIATGWDMNPPAPELPERVMEKARERYLHIHRMLTGHEPS